MRTNAKMKQCINSLKIDSLTNYSIDLTRAKNVIFPNFYEWDGCVLLSQDRNGELPALFSPNQFVPDRTALEADYNHIHLNDIFVTSAHPDAILNIGIKILEVWAAVLYKQFNGRKNFMIILSYDSEEVVLRFYRVRQDEVTWLDTSKLESYSDGLMLIEI